jgi:hypothetical protein
MDDFDGFCLKEHMKGNGGILAGKYPRWNNEKNEWTFRGFASSGC